ncbi:ATP-binding protein [Maribacter polysiphoniae]|uniref:AAA domain-containing protein n=1 Tax=Maribacter polysiphoniae TaxID=429344 RepID=A0A316DZW7_9FLAO|nr:ATP-binding protein [Maribacter polysiphoniae]MBD1261520.1 ATP-binding protein [Maribacter polysiphoniae]PWK22852.1 AAA domain-containing protein [Maribacter polysiphoniae]
MKQPPKNRRYSLHNFNVIQNACEMAQTHHKFFAIVGKPGSGKTVGLEYYKNSNPYQVKYIRVRQSMGIKDFFYGLQNLYNLDKRRNIHRFMNWLESYYQELDESHLLIIDEGGKFKYDQYSFIHELRDLTHDKLGIVLSGPGYYLDKIESWNSRSLEGVPEFYRRLNMIIKMDDLTRDEIISVCKDHSVTNKSVLKEHFFNLKTIGDLINALHNYLFYGNGLNALDD